MICDCWMPMYSEVLDAETLANYKYLQQDINFDNYFKTCSFMTNRTSINYYDGRVVHNINYVSRIVDVTKMHVAIPFDDKCKCVLTIVLVVFDVRFGLHTTFQFNIDITGVSYVSGVGAPEKTFESIECEDVMRVVDRDMFDDLNEQQRRENNEQILALEELFQYVSWLYGYLSNISEWRWKLANEVQWDCLSLKKFYVPLRFIELFRFYTRHKNTIIHYFNQHCNCGFFTNIDIDREKKCVCSSNKTFNLKLISMIK